MIRDGLDGDPLRSRIGIRRGRGEHSAHLNALLHPEGRRPRTRGLAGFRLDFRPGQGPQRIRRGSQRYIALMGVDTPGRIETDPAGSRDEDFAPGVQRGAIRRRGQIPAPRDDSGLQQNAIAGGETGRESQGAEHHGQEPGGFPGRSLRPGQNGFQLHGAGLGRTQNGQALVNRLCHIAQHLHEIARLGLHPRQILGQSRTGLGQMQVGVQFLAELFGIVEGIAGGIGLDQEIERIDRLQIGQQIHGQPERGHRLRQVQPRLMVLVGITDPVEEMRLGIHLEGPGAHGCPGMGRRMETQPVRRQQHVTLEALLENVGQGYECAHAGRRKSRVKGKSGLAGSG